MCTRARLGRHGTRGIGRKMTELPLHVIKVGGSLLTWAGLRDALRRFIDQDRASRHLLIVGGGELVDAIRQWNDVHRLADDAAHWMCIEAMEVSAQMLSSLFPSFRLTGDIQEASGATEPTIFATRRFLVESEASYVGTKLPQSWDATSDSIAARIAEVLGASCLTLLKSTCGEESLETAAKSGIVDPFLPNYNNAVPSIKIVNLRQSNIKAWGGLDGVELHDSGEKSTRNS